MEQENLAPPYMPKEEQRKPVPQSKKEDVGAMKSEVYDEINNIVTRLRVVDEKYQTMQRKVSLTDETLLSNTKKLKAEIKAISEEMTELRSEVSELKDDLKVIISELKKTARIEQVDILKKYIDLWEPVNFVTKEQLRKIINDLKEEFNSNKGE